MNEIDAAFYRLTVKQRDAAWQEVEALREVVRLAHEILTLQFHTIVWNRLTPEQIEAVDRALTADDSGARERRPTPDENGSEGVRS